MILTFDTKIYNHYIPKLFPPSNVIGELKVSRSIDLSRVKNSMWILGWKMALTVLKLYIIITNHVFKS